MLKKEEIKTNLSSFLYVSFIALKGTIKQLQMTTRKVFLSHSKKEIPYSLIGQLPISNKINFQVINAPAKHQNYKKQDVSSISFT